MHKTNAHSPETAKLRRRLSLPLLVLYGLGVTVGAGIYVLVGATAARAGLYAPASFLLAALVVAFTGFSYAELSTRFPVSAGEAAYVRNGLRSNWLALIVGLMVAASGVVSASAVTIGAAGYIGDFTPFSETTLIISIVVVSLTIAIWGILESVSMAAALTVIELVGLGLVIIFGIHTDPDLFSRASDLIPPWQASAWMSIGSASLLAFFAFVGFEDLANVAEEAVNPRRNMPRAIIWTLVITTLIYLAVVSVVILVVPLETLTTSSAPLNLVFSSAPEEARTLFDLIATVATLNGVLIQMIMASRVLYGLAEQGQLPSQLAIIHPKTHTPIMASCLVGAIILALSIFFPIEHLAEATASIALCVFAIVNVALIILKLRAQSPDQDIYQVSIVIPIIGCVSCVMLLAFGLI